MKKILVLLAIVFLQTIYIKSIYAQTSGAGTASAGNTEDSSGGGGGDDDDAMDGGDLAEVVVTTTVAPPANNNINLIYITPGQPVPVSPSTSSGGGGGATTSTPATTATRQPPKNPCATVNSYIQAGIIPPALAPDFNSGPKVGDFCIIPAHSGTANGVAFSVPSYIGYVRVFTNNASVQQLTCSTSVTGGFMDDQPINGPNSTWFTNPELSDSSKSVSQEIADITASLNPAQLASLQAWTPAQVAARAAQGCN